MSDLSLTLIKGSSYYDVTELVEQVKWKGRKGSSSRTLQVKMVDDDGYLHARSGINAEEGHQFLFCYKGSELFRGIIMNQSQTSNKRMNVTAYDNGIYLANNKDTFNYTNKTGSEIFKDCCTRFGLPMGEVANCTYRIPELTKSKTTAFDAIADALSLDFDATGIRHYVASEKGKLKLLTRRENIVQWVLETGQNLTNYTYTRSIEDVKTRVKLVSKEGTTLAERKNTALESKIGIFQEIDKPDEDLTAAQINGLIQSMMDEKSTPERTLDVDAMGIPEIISGVGVYVIIPELGLSRTFYVDEDTHTFDGSRHTMNLKLNSANDLSKETKSTAASSTASSGGGSGGGTQKKTYSVGDVVQFKGGYHYVSSNATNPTGSRCAAGPAKITLQAKGARHPWHLIHTNSSSRVYGWVDEGTFE